MYRHVRHWGPVVLLLLLLFASLPGAPGAAYPVNLVGSAPAQAPRVPAAPAVPLNHDRGGQLTWEAVGSNTAQFQITVGLRRSYFNPPPNIGDTVVYTPLHFGDGQNSPTGLYTVTYVNPSLDLFVAELTVSHTYSGPGPWVAWIGTCCRLGQPPHVNNPGLDLRAETVVDFAVTRANPRTSLPPFIDCPQNGLCTFVVPALDPYNQPVRFRFATSTEAGDPNFVQPGPPHAPNAATLDLLSGVYAWDTTGATVNPGGATYYSTQVMVENLGCAGSPASKTPLDFFIRLVPTAANQQPTFVAPTPPDGTLFTVLVGDTLIVPLEARDADLGDNVGLEAFNRPPDATFPIPAPGNPVNSTLTWTPNSGDLGPHIVNFIATDSQDVSTLTSIRIDVVASGTATPVPCVTHLPPPPSATPTATNTPALPTATAPPAPPTATPCTINFSDVDQNNPFYPFIRCLACRGIISGYSDGTFRWGADVTRGQLAKIIAGAAGLGNAIPSAQQTFSDVPNANTFWLFIERLQARGAISGYACGGPGEPCDPQQRPYFRWGANATRGQIAKITAVTAGWNGPIPPTQQTFADVLPSNPFWLWIEELANRQIIAGYTCGGAGEPCDPQSRPYFRWGANATRGQMSKIAAQAFFPNCQTP